MSRAIVLILVLGVAASASAQSPEPERVSSDDEARDLFDRASVAYADARYGEALRLFERAFELSGRPALLYNIGLAADRLRQDEKAADAFERYLASGEDARRAEVERRLAASRARMNATPTSPSEPGPAPSRVGPWTLGAVGAALAIAGVVALAIGAGRVADVESTEPGTVAWSEVRGDAESGRKLSLAGLSMLAVGAAAGVVSLSWRLATPSPEEPSSVAGFQLTVRGTF